MKEQRLLVAPSRSHSNNEEDCPGKVMRCVYEVGELNIGLLREGRKETVRVSRCGGSRALRSASVPKTLAVMIQVYP